ncbi:hypothetical protein MBLNU457_3738t1 [Dothideomycetes sp. NU457]
MLDQIGLAQYAQVFADEGFDTWSTLMDIVESDLEALGVKLGHRRKLQRAIVDYRGHTKDNFPIQPLPTLPRGDPKGNPQSKPEQAQDNQSQTGQRVQAKRKYRRHPKPDEHAPERPPSAYVIFSNQMREVLKGQDLSFTEIAKLVGERWQGLDLASKEPCERQAQEMKEKYYNELSEYKKTEEYQTYQKYLNEFKAKHNQKQNAKRPRTDTHGTHSRNSSRERTVDDGASHTDESAREGTSPGSTTLDNSSHRPDNPAVLQWRSAVEPPNASTKGLPTAISPQASSFRRPTMPPEESSRPGLTSDSGSRTLLIPSSSSGVSRLGSSSSRDMSRAESQNWRPSTVPESLPSLTREDTNRTGRSSEMDSTPDSWPSRMGMSPLALDNAKAPFGGGRILPAPPGFVPPGGAVPKTRVSALGFSPSSQPQRSSNYEVSGHALPTYRTDHVRFQDEHSTSPNISPRDRADARPHSLDPSVAQVPPRWTSDDSRNAEDPGYEQQKARATMGLATLLRASEHLEDRPSQSTHSDNSEAGGKGNLGWRHGRRSL